MSDNLSDSQSEMRAKNVYARSPMAEFKKHNPTFKIRYHPIQHIVFIIYAGSAVMPTVIGRGFKSLAQIYMKLEEGKGDTAEIFTFNDAASATLFERRVRYFYFENKRGEK